MWTLHILWPLDPHPTPPLACPVPPPVCPACPAPSLNTNHKVSYRNIKIIIKISVPSSNKQILWSSGLKVTSKLILSHMKRLCGRSEHLCTSMVFSDFRKLRLGATSADVWQNWLKPLGSFNPSIKKEGRGAHRHKYSQLQRCALIGWEVTTARYLQVSQQVIHLYFNHLKKLQLHWKKKQTSTEIKKTSFSCHFISF